MAKAHFTPALFDFLRELTDNNERTWFEANKKRYEKDVREPMLAFITDFAPRLSGLTPHCIASAKKVGGSMFRPNRDVRFSNDKSPYKTHCGAHFTHIRAKDVHAPGFYLGLEVDKVMVGTGIWQPDTPSLAKIRDAIVADPKDWELCISGDFAKNFEVRGERLKNAPKGYDKAHPLVETLKLKDFVGYRNLTEADACKASFIDDYTALCRAAVPFNRFLRRSLGLEF